jgi:hypothetical protein
LRRQHVAFADARTATAAQKRRTPESPREVVADEANTALALEVAAALQEQAAEYLDGDPDVAVPEVRWERMQNDLWRTSVAGVVVDVTSRGFENRMFVYVDDVVVRVPVDDAVVEAAHKMGNNTKAASQISDPQQRELQNAADQGAVAAALTAAKTYLAGGLQ